MRPHTAGVKRQYNGNRGKVENCVNAVLTGETKVFFSYQNRNAAASRAHHKTRLQQLHRLGIDPGQIKSVLPKLPPC